jgi:multiple antibiotic resistance protein
MIAFAGIASNIFHKSSTSLREIYFQIATFAETSDYALAKAGLLAVRKFFGVILLAIAVKMFAINAPGLIK